MCFLHLLHFVLQVAPELQGGGKRKNPAPPLLWEQRSASWYAGTVGKTCPRVDEKSWVEWTYNVLMQYTWLAWGAALRTQRNWFCNFFRADPRRAAQALNDWMSEWVSALSRGGTCLVATCTLGQVIAAPSKARFTCFNLTYIAV